MTSRNGKKVNAEKGKQGFQPTTPQSPTVPSAQEGGKRLRDEAWWYPILHPFKAAKRREAESAEWDAKDAAAVVEIARSLTEYANVSAENVAALEDITRLVEEEKQAGRASAGPVTAPDCTCGHTESIHDTPGRYGNPAYCLEGNGACKCPNYTPVR